MDENGDVRVILIEDLDPESPTYGAMSLGSLGFQIANKRTADDTDWEWTTFGNAQGFNADLIIAGTLQAINIVGSIITGGTINGTDINGTNITGSTISGTSITSQVTSGQNLQIAELDEGRVRFTNENSTSTTNNTVTEIGPWGLTFDRPNGAIPTQSVFGQTARFTRPQTNLSSELSASQFSITNYATGQPRNGVFITASNIEVYNNGIKVWSAL